MFLFRNKTLILNKELRRSLRVVFGVGALKALIVTTKIGMAYPFFINNLNSYNFSLVFFLLKYLTLGESRLRRFVENRILNLIEINSYVGLRHKQFLPVHGQRTRTNSGTRKKLRFKHKLIN